MPQNVMKKILTVGSDVHSFAAMKTEKIKCNKM